MISYQWDCKPDVIELQNKLQKEGFKVWRDEDNMGMQAYHTTFSEKNVVLNL